MDRAPVISCILTERRTIEHVSVAPTSECIEKSSSMRLGNPIPIPRIFDEAKAKEFYLDFLGFQLDWEHRFEAGLPLYMQVSRDGCILHLSEHHDDGSPGTALRIQTNGLETLQRELIAKPYRYARPEIEETPWGSRDMSVHDPFGNRLTFTNSVGTERYAAMRRRNGDDPHECLRTTPSFTGSSPGNHQQEDQPMRMSLLHLPLTLYAALMLTSCASSPQPEDMRRLAEKNRWELAHWGNRPVPHGDDGEPVILMFKDGRVSGHAGCNRYSAAIVFGPRAGETKVSKGITTRMACEPRHMEFEASFIQAFEASTRYRLDGESLSFESDSAPPLEFYRRPLDQ